MEKIINILEKCSTEELIQIFLLNRKDVLQKINFFINQTSKSTFSEFFQVFVQAYKNIIVKDPELIDTVVNNISQKVNINVDKLELISFLIKTKLFYKCFSKIFNLLDVKDIIKALIIDRINEQYVMDAIYDAAFNNLVNIIITNNLSVEKVLSTSITDSFLIFACIEGLEDYYTRHQFYIFQLNESYIKKQERPLLLLPELKQDDFNTLGKEFFRLKKDELYNKCSSIEVDELQDAVDEENYYNFDDIDIEIGESIPLDRELFHALTHTDQYIPLIYVNGNVVVGKAVEDKINGRLHHSVLFKNYCTDASLHKFDIIKKPIEEWQTEVKGLTTYSGEIYQLMMKYKVVRAVRSIRGTAVAIPFAVSNAEEAARAFKSQLAECDKVFAFNDSLTELERKAKCRRLMCKI